MPLPGIPSIMVARLASFSPTQIAGLQLWLKADAIVGLSDGDPVATWPDSSGNANDATQATGGAQPTYKTNIQNGNPIVRFDGSADFMSLTSSVSSVLPYTVFAVYKKRVSGGLMPIMTSSMTSALYTWLDFSDGNAYIQSRGNSYFFVAANYTTFKIISQISQASDNEAAWVNGAAQSLTTGAPAGAAFDFDLIVKRGTDFGDGDIAEVLFYNSVLSTTDREKVQNYLNSKYAIY